MWSPIDLVAGELVTAVSFSVIPVKTEIQRLPAWIPVFTGMTNKD